jgi:DNA polymerase III delta prime subunit
MSIAMTTVMTMMSIVMTFSPNDFFARLLEICAVCFFPHLHWHVHDPSPFRTVDIKSFFVGVSGSPIEACIPEAFEVNAVIDVPLFSATGELGKMFVREDSVKQWEFLKSNPRCLITGPPGVGKTSLARAFALRMSQNGTSDVLYIHLFRGFGTDVVLVSGQEVKMRHVANSDVGLVITMIQTSDNLGLIVLDGLKAGNRNCEDLQSASLGKETVPVLLLSSMQYPMDPQTMIRCKLKRVEPCFQSWDLAEFEVACNLDPFWETIKDNFPIHSEKAMSLSEKYFFAGGSARWMFQHTVQEVRVFIDEKLNTTSNVNELVQHLKGEKATDAVNSLCQQSRSRDGTVHRFLISQYVMRCSMQWADETAVLLLVQYAKAMDNDALKGWAFEMQCLHNWKQNMARKFPLTYKDTCTTTTSPHTKTVDNEMKCMLEKPYTLEWSGPGQVCSLSRDGTVVPTTTDVTPVLIIPTLWNHGCFDCIFWYQETRTIWFISCTISLKHSRKLRFINDFIAKLSEDCRPEHVHLVAIVQNNPEGFKCEASESSAANAPKIHCWATAAV